jgi:acyl carrier protein
VTRAEIQEQIIAFIANHFELDPATVTPQASFFEDLGLDSIDAVELVLHLSELTKDTISEENLRQIVTIADIVDLVVKLRDEQAQQSAATAE